MQSSTSKVNIPIRYEDGHLVIECASTDMLADVADRFPDLIADQDDGICVLLDMSKVESIKGDGLETLMQVHELGQDHSVKVGMFQVAFYVQQLLAVLDLHDQLPLIVDGDEAEAAKALKAHGTDPNNETDVDFEFELPGDDPEDSSDDISTVKLPREQFLAAPSDSEAGVSTQDDPSADYLAVDFSDFQAPVQEVEEDDTFEISLDGDMAFADTDKFSLSDVAQAVKDQANEGSGVVYDDSNDSWDDDDTADNAQSIGLSVQRPTEVFPAFSDLEKGSLLGGASHSGLDSLLAVDFDDFRPANAAVTNTETPPDGVPKLKDTPTDIVDVGDFELDYESSDDNAFAPTTTTTNSVSLLGTAADDSGYSPVGDLAPPPAENPYAKQAYKAAEKEEAETKVFSSDQLTANIPLARMETQEMDIPNWTLLETAKIDSATVPTPPDLEIIDESVSPPPVQTFNPVEGLSNTPPVSQATPPVSQATPPVSHSAPTQQYQVDSLYSEEDDQQSAVMFQLTPEAQAQIQQSLQPKTPEPAPAVPQTQGGFMGDGEESMIFNADAAAQIQAVLAAEAAKLGLNQPAAAAKPEPQEDVSLLETQQLPRVDANADRLSESQRLLQQERAQLAEERRKLEEERARFKIEAERRKLEEERRKFDEERRKIDEERKKLLAAQQEKEAQVALQPSESQRIKLQQELEVAREANRQLVIEAAEAERKRLEAELRAIREGEQKKLEIDAAREAERKRLEEQFRLSADAERKRLETEIQAAREAARRKKAEADAAKKDQEPKQWGGPKKKDKSGDSKRRSTDEVKSIEEQTALKAAQTAKEQENQTRNKALSKFCEDYAINSALHMKILGHLKRVGGRPEGKIEVSKVVESNQAIVGQILDDFVQAKIVKRVRAPRIRGGYGYSFSASPKTRNMIVTLLRLSEDGEKWPAF